MKKVVLIASLGLMAIGFNACKKDGGLQPSSSIPKYSSFEEVDERLKQIESMTDEERIADERSRSFKSLLTKTYEIYERLDIESVKSVNDVRSFVAQYPNFIELKSLDNGFVGKNDSYDDEDEEGLYECNPLFSDHLYSPIADENRMFIVDNMCYKIFEDGEAATLLENLDLLKAIDEVYGENLSWDSRIIFSKYEEAEIEMKSFECHRTHNVDRVDRGRNRTKLEFKCGRRILEIKTNKDGAPQDVREEVWSYGRIRPYMRTLGIWYHCKRTISGRIRYEVTYRLQDGTVQTLSRDETIPHSGTVYHRTRSANRPLGWSIVPSNVRFTRIDSWGSTPSTSQTRRAEIDCIGD